MKVILSGYQGSKKIITASAFLATKHLKGFDVYYLNYGEFKGELFGANYVSLKDKQERVDDWSADIAEYLETLEDEKIIFALDDYLLESDMDMELYESVKHLPYANLCAGSMDNDESYYVTTQYTLWDKQLLLEILGEVKTPWQFEIVGSQYFKKIGGVWKCVPALKYPEWSALSSRWEGVRTYGREVKYL